MMMKTAEQIMAKERFLKRNWIKGLPTAISFGRRPQRSWMKS